MGLKDTFKRLLASDNEAEERHTGNEALAIPEDHSAQGGEQDHLSARTHSPHSQRQHLTESIEAEPKKITGKRKPSTRHSRPKAHRQPPDLQPRSVDEEPAPSEYLYFGPADRPHPSSSTSATAGLEDASHKSGMRAEGQSTTSEAAAEGRAGGTGRDDSGFLNTGVRVQNAGYSSLTYGGTLQFDYAGTQGGGSGAP